MFAAVVFIYCVSLTFSFNMAAVMGDLLYTKPAFAMNF